MAAILFVFAAAAQAGPIKALRIELAPGGNAPELKDLTLAGGDTLRVWAAGYEQNGAFVGAVPVGWEAPPAHVGLQPASGTSTSLRALLVGSFTLVVRSADGLTDSSGTLTVVAGAPVRLGAFAAPPVAQPPLASLQVSADSTLVLYAGGIDAGGNVTGSTAVTWSLDVPLATLVPAQAALTVLDARRAGSAQLRLDASGMPRLTVPLEVRPGALAALRVELQGATARALGDTTVTLGTSLPLQAAAFDADGNRWTSAPVVSWEVLGTGGTLSNLSGPTTLLRATSPGSARIAATRSGVTASTGIVSSVPGPLARLRLSLQPDAWVPIGPTTLDADRSLDLYALGEDASGFGIGPVPATWKTNNGAVLLLGGTTGSRVRADAARIGAARLYVSAAGALPDSSATIMVVPGSIASLRIESRPDGSGLEIGPVLLSADSVLALHAVGRDADGNFVSARSAAWSLDAPIGRLSAPSGASVVLEATRPGTALVAATDFLRFDSAGPVTVTAGAPHHVRIEDAAGILGARLLRPGDTLELFAALRDADDNALGRVPARWSWIGDALAPVPLLDSQSFAWVAARTGRGRLVIQAASALPDTSAWITVSAGSIARLEIRSAAGGAGAPVGARPLSADSTLALFAAAYDVADNFLGDVPALWSVGSQGGTARLETLIGAATRLQPDRRGNLTVLATHASGVDAETGLLSIQPGALAQVSIETAAGARGDVVGARTLRAGERLALHAMGRDAHGNALGSQPVSWLLFGDVGRLEAAFGDSTRFVAGHAGTGYVQAVHAFAAAARTGDLTVQPGPLARVEIRAGTGEPGLPVGAGTLAADSALVLHAAGFDAGDNLLGEVPVRWSALPTASGAHLEPQMGSSSLLQPWRTGVLHVAAVHASGASDTTGALQILPGALARLVLESARDGGGVGVEARSLVAGERLKIFAIGRDAHDNIVGAQDVRWSLNGDIGRLQSSAGDSTELVAERRGRGWIAAAHAVLDAARTGDLTVLPGAPALLLVERTPGDPQDALPDTRLTCDDSLAASAVLRDAFGNWIADVQAGWTLLDAPGSGTLAPAGPARSIVFRPQLPGAPRLRASWNGLEAASGVLDVTPGAPEGSPALAASPESLRADARSSTRLACGPLRDRFGNRVQDGTLATFTSDAGRLDPVQDVDAVQSGVQRPTSGGIAEATLLAPQVPGDLTVQVVAGRARAEHRIVALPQVALAVVPGSLRPADVLRGDSIAVRVRVTSADPIGLRVEQAALRFGDGSGGRFEALLADSVRLDPSLDAELRFAAGLVPETTNLGAYTPQLVLSGHDDLGFSWSATLSCDTASLRVTALRILAVRADRAQALRGDTLLVQVDCLASTSNLRLDAAGTGLQCERPGDWDTRLLGPDDGTMLPAGRLTHLRFAAVARQDALLGASRLDASLRVRGAVDTLAVQGADSACSVVVVEGARAAVVARTPQQISSGQPVRFDVDVRNDGDADAFLDARACMLQSAAAGFTALLDADGDTMLEAGGVSRLRFLATSWPAGSAPGDADLALVLRGRHTNRPYAQDLGVPPVRVQSPARLEVRPASLAPHQVAQDTRARLWLWLGNSGGSSAWLDAGSVLRIADRGTALAAPVHVEPDSTGELFFQDLDLAGLPQGLQAVRLEARGSQNGVPFAQDLALEDSLRIVAPAALALADLVPSQARLSAGMSRPWSLACTLGNAGGLAVVLDSVRVRCWRAERDVTGEYGFVLPHVFADGSAQLPAGAARSLQIGVVRTGTSTGDVRVDVFAALHEENTGRSLGWISTEAGGAARVRVEVPAQARIVSFAPSQVRAVTGQSDAAAAWRVDLVLTNAGGADLDLFDAGYVALVDDVDRTPEYVFAAPSVFAGSGTQRLAGGATDTLRLQVIGTGATPGTLRWRARLALRDALSGEALAESTLDASPVLVVGPADLAATAPRPSAARVTSGGRRTWSFDTQIENRGQAPLEIADLHSALTLQLEGSDRTADFAPRAVPSSAHLDGGQRLDVRFEIASTPALAGEVQAQLQLRALEVDSRRVLDLEALATGPRLELPARLRARSLAPLRTSRGGPVRFVVRLVNEGQASADLDTTSALGLHGWRVALASAARVAGGDSLDLELARAFVPPDFPLGPTPALLAARGTQNGDALVQDVPAGDVRIEERAALALLEFAASQPEVVIGQAAPTGAWHADLVVENAGGADLEIDTLVLQAWEDGVDRSSEFEFALPQAFRGSATATLAAGQRDTLRVGVTRTGTTPGRLRLRARLRVRDAASGAVLPDVSLDSQPLALVRPAELAAGPLHPSRQRVLAGGTTPWSLQVEIENRGQAVLSLTDLGQALVLRLDGQDRSTDFAPSPSVQNVTLASGARTALEYRLASTPDLAGDLRAELHLSAIEAGSNRILALDLDAPGPRLDRPAALEAVALSPLQASVGTPVLFALRVTNTGEATAELDSSTSLAVGALRVRLGTALQVASSETVQVALRQILIPADQPLGPTPAILAVHGLQDGELLAQEIPAGEIRVESPAALAILGLEPSQARVTRAQDRPWRIDLVLRNAGQADYRLESAEVRVFVGGVERTSTYSIALQKPAGVASVASGLDTLRFLVAHTGPDAGLATLEGSVRAVDENSGHVVDANTFMGGKGHVQVQAPGLAVGGSLQLSQTTITSGQTRSFEVRLPLRNAGEAEIVLDTDSLAAGFTSQPSLPARAVLESGAARLAAGETALVRWDVGPCDVPAGNLRLSAAPRLVETNTGEVHRAQIFDSLLVQSPARVLTASGEAPARVSRAQARPWSVRFALENRGQSAARLLDPHLVLRRGSQDVGAAFGVQPPSAFDAGTDLELPGGAAGTLTFRITTTDSSLGDLGVALGSRALETNSGRTFDLEAASPLTVHSEREPELALLDSTLAPRAASRGQDLAPSLRVRQTGEATLELDAARSRARLVGTSWSAALAAPVTLRGGQEGELRFAAVPVPQDVPAGLYALQLHLEGTHNDNPWSADLETAALLRVEAASDLAIESVRAAQDLVTAGQERPWSVRVALRNHGAAAALETAALSFTLGAEDVGARFTTLGPVSFESGRAQIEAGAADTLRFEVQRSADLLGLVVLDAMVRVRDLNSGAGFEARSLGAARGSVRLASPARPVVTSLLASQARVSAGQRGSWSATMQVRNDGGSPWRPDWTSAVLHLGSAPDDSVVAPVAFDSSAAQTLAPGGAASARFLVARTGSETGLLDLACGLQGVQETDARRLEVVPQHAPAQVRAQKPARAQLVGFVALAPRAPRIDAGQEVPFEIRIGNAGEAGLENVELVLRAANATPAETTLAFALPGGQEKTLQARLRFDGGTGARHVALRGTRAVDANDSTRTAAWDAPLAADLDLQAQAPGILRLVAEPSQTRLSARQDSPWWITLHVTNDGEEPLVLQRPRSGDLEFLVRGAAQADYVVEVPAALDSGGLEVAGGTRRTLRYRVVHTGSAGGPLELRAALQASHANDPESAPATARAQAQLEVDGQAGVRLYSTESITWRRLRGLDDFRVDTGQRFSVRVVVQNTGGTPLDSIRVELESQRGNSSITSPGMLAELHPSQSGEIEFPVVAGSLLSQAGLPETFVAHILSARDRNSGLSVLPGAAVDNTSFAYVESPAELDLQAWIESPAGARDGTLSAGQSFVLAARVDDAGQAEISTSGRVRLQIPADYALLEGESEPFFTAGADLRWRLQAPARARAGTDTLRVTLSVVPQDQNSGEPAAVRRGTWPLGLQVRDTGALEARLSIVSPAGARDAVLSSGQQLDLELVLRADPELVQRRAELELPAGWSLRGGESAARDLSPDPETTARWQLVAGGATPDVPLVVRVAALDRNDGTPRQAADTLVVQVQRAARLGLAAAIVAPEEARDGQLLPGQRFTLRAWVSNRGEAGLASAPGGTLRLADLPAGYAADPVVQPLVLDVTGRASLDWRLTAPASFRPDVESLRLVFDTLPLDVNAGTPAGLEPDSSQALCRVALSDDRVLLESQPAAASLAVPGQRDVPLLHAAVSNQAAAAVSLDSLGVLVLAGGAPVSDPRRYLRSLRLVRDDAAADTLVAALGAGNPVWFAFPAQGGGKTTGLVSAHQAARYTLRADFSPRAAAQEIAVALRDPGSGRLYLRAVEQGSRTPIAVGTPNGSALASQPLRVLAAGLEAYSAPNPFHVGQETTSIRYRLDATADVHVRIYTLQGGLVWEARRHVETTSPTLGGVEWDGKNGSGQAVRNGVYVCRVSAGAHTASFKIAVVR